MKYTIFSISNVPFIHRYALEIPEPVPSRSLHRAQFGDLRVFPVIKIIVVRQVRVLPACTAV